MSSSTSTPESTLIGAKAIKEKGESVVVTVIGTGQYGRNLAARLRRAPRAEVRVGSRNPGEGQFSVKDAVTDADIVFLAVPANKHDDVVQSIRGHLAPEVVVVDVSNHALCAPPSKEWSIAEKLQDKLRGVTIVKAFNTLSSYTLADQKRTPTVYFATDSSKAVDVLSALCYDAALVPVHSGGLKSARELEAVPHRLFPTWRSSIVVGAVVLAWWVLYNTLAGFVIYGPTRPGREPGPSREGRKWPLETFMSATGEASITMFALTFLPGPIAGLIQLVRHSSSRPFGKFFGSWLDTRKEVGVIAFFYATMHGIAGAITAAHLGPDSNWIEHAYFTLGIISYSVFAILAVSTLPSVAEAMSWNEFRAIFSWVGTVGLIFGVLHQGFWGWILHRHRPTPAFWVGNGTVMPSYWLGIILPLLALFVRFVTWSPCIALSLRKIRNEVRINGSLKVN